MMWPSPSYQISEEDRFALKITMLVIFALGMVAGATFLYLVWTLLGVFG